jgi:hypothetical protein
MLFSSRENHGAVVVGALRANCVFASTRSPDCCRRAHEADPI